MERKNNVKEIVINTPCGQVKGISKDKVNMFLGIRYGTTIMINRFLLCNNAENSSLKVASSACSS
jgi:carboxylesterase type B